MNDVHTDTEQWTPISMVCWSYWRRSDLFGAFYYNKWIWLELSIAGKNAWERYKIHILYSITRALHATSPSPTTAEEEEDEFCVCVCVCVSRSCARPMCAWGQIQVKYFLNDSIIMRERQHQQLCCSAPSKVSATHAVHEVHESREFSVISDRNECNIRHTGKWNTFVFTASLITRSMSLTLIVTIRSFCDEFGEQKYTLEFLRSEYLKYLKYFWKIKCINSPAGRFSLRFDPSSSVSNGWNRRTAPVFGVHTHKTMPKSSEIDFMSENTENCCESFAIFSLFFRLFTGTAGNWRLSVIDNSLDFLVWT